MNEKVIGHTESNEKTEIYDFGLFVVFAHDLRAHRAPAILAKAKAKR